MDHKVTRRDVTLLHGDCLELMKKIRPGSIDLVLTDPPYGTTACKWDSVIPFEPMWREIWRVLKSNGACVLFGSEPFSSHLRMSQIKHFKYDWIWTKSNATGHTLAKCKPLKRHELISIFSKGSTYHKNRADVPMSYYPQGVNIQGNISGGNLKTIRPQFFSSANRVKVTAFIQPKNP